MRIELCDEVPGGRGIAAAVGADRGRRRRSTRIASAALAAWIMVVVAAPAPAASPTPEDSPRPDSTASPAAAAPKTSARCEEYVAVLSGKKQDDALFADPKVKAIVARSFDLLACRAVAADADAPCALLAEQQDECRLLRSIFHELRTNPHGRSFMFPDAKYEMCRADPKRARICDRLREAMRSGDPGACAGTGVEEPSCRAALTLDESWCAEAQDPEGCRKGIEASRVFAPGLEALAASGPAREAALAKAALGDTDACTSFAAAAVGYCSDLTAVPAASPSVEATKVPALPRRGPARK